MEWELKLLKEAQWNQVQYGDTVGNSRIHLCQTPI